MDMEWLLVGVIVVQAVSNAVERISLLNRVAPPEKRDAPKGVTPKCVRMVEERRKGVNGDGDVE